MGKGRVSDFKMILKLEIPSAMSPANSFTVHLHPPLPSTTCPARPPTMTDGTESELDYAADDFDDNGDQHDVSSRPCSPSRKKEGHQLRSFYFPT